MDTGEAVLCVADTTELSMKKHEAAFNIDILFANLHCNAIYSTRRSHSTGVNTHKVTQAFENDEMSHVHSKRHNCLHCQLTTLPASIVT